MPNPIAQGCFTGIVRLDHDTLKLSCACLENCNTVYLIRQKSVSTSGTSDLRHGLGHPCNNESGPEKKMANYKFLKPVNVAFWH